MASLGTVAQFSFEVLPPISSSSIDVKILDIFAGVGEVDPIQITPTGYNLTFSNSSVPEPSWMAVLIS